MKYLESKFYVSWRPLNFSSSKSHWRTSSGFAGLPQLCLSLAPWARLWLIIPEHLHLYGAYLETLIYANGESGPGMKRGQVLSLIPPRSTVKTRDSELKIWAGKVGRMCRVFRVCVYFITPPQSLGPTLTSWPSRLPYPKSRSCPSPTDNDFRASHSCLECVCNFPRVCLTLTT